MQLTTLNMQHGGGTRAAAIGRYLASQTADILVLTEYRENRSGQTIREHLAQVGHGFFASSRPAPNTNGVAVASRVPFTTVPHPSDGLPANECRWLECVFPDFRLVANYFPGGRPKLEYWKWFMPQATLRADLPCLLVGDFNTGKHRIDEVGATFYGPEYMTAMESVGWIDAWRHLNADGREYTWRSNAGGEFRLDYVWLSRPLARCLRSASHDPSPRTQRLTDHSALTVDLTVTSFTASLA